MNLKLIGIFLFVLLLGGCRALEETTFSVTNQTDRELEVKVFEKFRNNDFDIPPGKSQIIKKIEGMDGTDFEYFSLIDSVIIKESGTSKKMKWYRPDNPYGYIAPNIGEERLVPKDFYNQSNWTPKHKINKVDWRFKITQENLKLFY